MNTPLTSKTTISSRNKMAAGLNNHAHSSTTAMTTTTTTTNTTVKPLASATASRLPPRTGFKPPIPKFERTTANLAATSSRIALSRSRLSANSTTAPLPAALQSAPADGSKSSRRLGTEAKSVTGQSRMPFLAGGRQAASKQHSFANSRSSSKLSSTSSAINGNSNSIPYNNNNYNDQASSRQSSLASNALATVRKHNNLTKESTIPTTSYIPDTNTIRKGLAKFSNPIECQRQFQTLNSKLRELTDINENKEKTIKGLQDQLDEALSKGVGYAIVVQYFSKKLKLDAAADLEEECRQYRLEIDKLKINESEFKEKLDSIVDDYKEHLNLEKDLRANIENELEETKVNCSNELVKLKELHETNFADLEVKHSTVKGELESRIQTLENDLKARIKELHDLRKEYDSLHESYNKLEESLTKDKDARVKYAQERANQLQKDVDSLNSVLDMRNERVHALEKDSILLSEVQHELMKTEDNNKALRQQLESLTAALENKRVQYEKLLAEHERVAQELKRERKERRRMTMRTEQLEYVLDQSCSADNNITALDASVET